MPSEFYYTEIAKGFPVKVPGGHALFVSSNIVFESSDYVECDVIQYDILYEINDEIFFMRGNIEEDYNGLYGCSKYLNIRYPSPNEQVLSDILTDPKFEKITDIEEFNGYDVIFPESRETLEYAMSESIPKESTEMTADDYKQLRKQGLLYW